MNKFHLSHKGLLGSVALAFSLFFTLGTAATQAQNGSEFAGGNGTEKNPWQIATKQQLVAMNNYMGDASKGKYFILTKDIKFTSEDFSVAGDFYNNGKYWAAIGNEWSDGFQGTFDGGNHEIKGIKINSEERFGARYCLHELSQNFSPKENAATVNSSKEGSSVLTVSCGYTSPSL